MQDVQEILENVDKAKISIIMQVNLEDYSGSRSNPVDKFKRAVTSFKNQIYKNCELIIVADGCNKTYQMYMRNYKNDPSIRFVYLDRIGVPKMYDEIEDKGKYYRGLARNVGVAAATGSLITYMDSDDFLTPEFTMTIMLYYNADSDKDWFLNTSWYDHQNVVNSTQNSTAITENFKAIPNVTIPGLQDAWKPMELKPGKMIMTPWLLTHKKSVKTEWRDILSYSTSEDVDFYNRMSAEYPNGIAFKKAIYARCHSSGLWDV